MESTSPVNLDFLKFLSTGPILVYILCDGDNYVWTNAQFQEFTEYSEEELLDMEHFWDLIHPEHKEMVKTIHLARVREEECPDHYEIKTLSKSGVVKWLDIFVTVEKLNGKRYDLIGAYDITSRINAQMALQEANDHLDQLVRERTNELTLLNHSLITNEKMFKSIIANISDGVIILTRQGQIEFVNQNLRVMLGRTSMAVRDQLNYESLTLKNPNIEQLLMYNKAFVEEEVSFLVNGRDMRFLASGTPIEDLGWLINKSLLILRPISEVHRLVNRFSSSDARFQFDDILTQNQIMLDTIEAAKQASQSKSTILIEGESGTGKELFAQSIHNRSIFTDGPFIAVNCGAIPRELIGSELFGYVEGAFTGARKGGNPGKFELARGGTLLLDEIGDMPLDQQAVLLRVLQEKQVCRLGGSKTIPVDVRVICATHKNLFNSVQEGTFRQDLYYRLNVISLRMPPLRERQEDIELLLKHFLALGDRLWIEHWDGIDSSVWNRLRRYQWPGNVREIQNFAERILFSVKNYSIKLETLPRGILDSFEKSSDSSALPSKQAPVNIKEQLADLERTQIELLLKKYKGNVSRVAENLGVSRRTIDRRIALYHIER